MSHNKADPSKARFSVFNELAKQILVVALVAGIAVWQNHFVVQAASADIYIFGLLIGAGLFGIYNVIRGTYALGNDFVALQAMKEIHQDVQRKMLAPADHAVIVAQRIKAPAVLYNPPTSLGTAHNLIIEEILRSGALRIPTATMQILVSDLEGKLDERQVMSHYMGALMVLLGLLGTFIGLMHTLESVGGILGSLDLSGTGGTGAIANLIESLKRPLEGMATGFGASLFGLIGSLVIGVLSKFDSRASHRLQREFEAWIRSAVQIEAAGNMPKTSPVAAGGNPIGLHDAGNWRTMFQVAKQTILATSRMSSQIGELSQSIGVLSQDIRNQNLQTEKWFAQMTWALSQDSAAHGSLARSVEALSMAVKESKQKVATQLDELAGVVDAASVKHDSSTLMVADNLRRLSENMLWHQRSIAEAGRKIEVAEDKIARVEERQSAVEAAGDSQSSVAELVATLEHLVAASRLNATDVHQIRKLSGAMSMAEGVNENISEYASSWEVLK